MRLLFLSNEFPNLCEPTKATFNYDLLATLAHEHAVTVVSPISWWDELRTRVAQPSQPWLRVRQWDQLIIHHPRFYYTPGLFRHWYGSFLWWSLRATVARLGRRPRPDCVLSYWAHPDGEAAVRLATRLGVPSVVMVGGSDVLLLTRTPRRRQCIRRALGRADAVVTVSQDLAEKVAALGVEPRRIHVLRRGVDSTCFVRGDRAAARRRLGLPSERPILLWIGRMVPVKGLDTLLAACARLREQIADFQLYLIGDGPLRSTLAADVERRQLASHVTFVGPVDHAQIGTWLQSADLTVLPSRSEGIPNVLLESLACGTPFVATAVGGIPELAGEAAGRLVPPDQPDALAAALAKAMTERPEVADDDHPATLQQFADRLSELIRDLRPPDRRSAMSPPSLAAPGFSTCHP